MEIAPENTESTGIAYRIALQLPVINRAAFCPLPSVKVRCCPLNPFAPCGTPTVRQLSCMSGRKARRRVRAKRKATAANVPLRGVAPFRCHGLIDHVSWKKDKKMARSAAAEAMAGQGDGTRHERSEVSVSSADRRSSSARQPRQTCRCEVSRRSVVTA